MGMLASFSVNGLTSGGRASERAAEVGPLLAAQVRRELQPLSATQGAQGDSALQKLLVLNPPFSCHCSQR